MGRPSFEVKRRRVIALSQQTTLTTKCWNSLLELMCISFGTHGTARPFVGTHCDDDGDDEDESDADAEDYDDDDDEDDVDEDDDDNDDDTDDDFDDDNDDGDNDDDDDDDDDADDDDATPQLLLVSMCSYWLLQCCSIELVKTIVLIGSPIL
jgi:hypothetical protein